MRKVIIADASPLIALARIDRLSLLKSIFSHIIIPYAVRDELKMDSTKPGAGKLLAAEKEGWLKTVDIKPHNLKLDLDQGEIEAIALALQVSSDFLLIDERKGRRAAIKHGIHVLGSARVLIAAKEKGLLVKVMPEIDKLAKAGYRLSDDIIERIKILSGEMNNN